VKSGSQVVVVHQPTEHRSGDEASVLSRWRNPLWDPASDDIGDVVDTLVRARFVEIAPELDHCSAQVSLGKEDLGAAGTLFVGIRDTALRVRSHWVRRTGWGCRSRRVPDRATGREHIGISAARLPEKRADAHRETGQRYRRCREGGTLAYSPRRWLPGVVA